MPIANGIVLTPRFRTAIKSVELSDSTIAIDGAPVTGRELRERLDDDADLVLQVSYLEPCGASIAGGWQNASADAGRAGRTGTRSRLAWSRKCPARRAHAAAKTSFASVEA